MKKIIPVLLVVFSTLFTVVLVEGISVLTLKTVKQYVRPFLYQSRAGLKGFVDHPKYQVLDPHLGYGRVPSVTTFGEPKGALVKIAALGGSTTDPNIQPENWSKSLHELLTEKGIPNVVYCAGVGGYSSHQETLKLIRDILPLQPDIVVSFTGVNDVNYAFSLPAHPMVHPYQFTVMNYLTNPLYEEPRFLPNTQIVLQKLVSKLRPPSISYDLGTEVDSTAAENWARNLRTMNAVATEFKVHYLGVLQPMLGVGQFVPSTRELDILTREGGDDFTKRTNAWYEAAGTSCRNTNHCVSFVDIFAGKSDRWDDARHPNPQGYREIAAAIMDEMTQRSWIVIPTRLAR